MVSAKKPPPVNSETITVNGLNRSATPKVNSTGSPLNGTVSWALTARLVRANMPMAGRAVTP